VLALVLSVVSSSAFAAAADDDDVRLIRFRRFPEEEDKDEAQKRPVVEHFLEDNFAVLLLFASRILARIDKGGENDALLLDIIIVVLSLRCCLRTKSGDLLQNFLSNACAYITIERGRRKNDDALFLVEKTTKRTNVFLRVFLFFFFS